MPPSSHRSIWAQSQPILVRPLLRSTALMSYLSFVLFTIAHGLNMWLPYIFTALIGTSTTTAASTGGGGGDSSANLCQMLRRYQHTGAPSNNSVAAATDGSGCTATAASSPIVYQLLLAYAGGCVLLFYAATLLMRRWSLRTILVVWFVGSAAAAVAFAWLPARTEDADGANLAGVVLLFVLFLSCGNCGCIVGAVAQDLFPTRVRAMALCAIFALGRLGSVLGSWALGAALMDDGSGGRCESVFWLSAGLLVSCAVLVGLGLPRSAAETENGESQ